MKVFDLNRHLRNDLHHLWMFAGLVLILLMPFIVGLGLYFKSSGLLEKYSIWELLTSSNWKPLHGKFGMLPFIMSSFWVTIVAVFISAPICILTAIYLTQYTKQYFLRMMHPLIDILAGIPSVIFGVWGILMVVPFVSHYVAPLFGKQSSGYTILSGAIVLSIMIIPFMLNILIDVFRTVPDEMMESAYSLGATKWQTIKHVLLKKSRPGIISALGLGVSRAFGETIAVLMVVGNVIHIPTGVLQAGYPLPALIANNYGEMMSIPLYDSALMLAAFVLFVVVVIFNMISRIAIVRVERNT